jgi:pimeloyl-ACP methyl ester carboxylesterase
MMESAMPEITLSAGTLAYRVVGPAESESPPVVFVHGFLVDGHLWDPVAERLAAENVRCVLPDLPLGSHRTPLNEGADRTPRGIARLINEFLAALDLDDVTLVGNDTGGAICQFLLDEDASRIGRVVFTNCDAFENFPPAAFVPLFKAGQRAGALRKLLQPTRSEKVRHSPLGFGLLAREFDAALTRSWVDPILENPAIAEDAAALLRGVDPAELNDVATRLGAFDRPVRVVWGEGDRFFKPKFGRRLAELFPQGSYVGVDDALTFMSLEAPDRVAAEILDVAAVMSA